MRNSKRIIVLALLFLIPALISAKAFIQPKPGTELSTWIWNQELYNDPTNVVSFALDNKVNALYCYVDTNNENREAINELIKLANKHEIKIFAVQGEPDMALNHNNLITWIDSIKQYNNEHKDKFSGIVIDVEPYLLEEWNSKKQNVINDYLKLIATVNNSTDLQVLWTIPFWFDTIQMSNQKTLAEEVFKRNTHVIVMAYRSKLSGRDGLLEHVKTEKKLSKKYNTNLILAVETKKDEVKKISYFNKGLKILNSDIEELKKEKISGVSIHYYDSWMEMEK